MGIQQGPAWVRVVCNVRNGLTRAHQSLEVVEASLELSKRTITISGQIQDSSSWKVRV